MLAAYRCVLQLTAAKEWVYLQYAPWEPLLERQTFCLVVCLHFMSAAIFPTIALLISSTLEMIRWSSSVGCGFDKCCHKTPKLTANPRCGCIFMCLSAEKCSVGLICNNTRKILEIESYKWPIEKLLHIDIVCRLVWETLKGEKGIWNYRILLCYIKDLRRMVGQ